MIEIYYVATIGVASAIDSLIMNLTLDVLLLFLDGIQHDTIS